MFYVYQRDNKKSELKVIDVFDTLVEMVIHHRYEEFSENNSDSEVRRTCSYWIDDHRQTTMIDYFKVCYNSNGKLIPFTEIVGAERERWWRWYNGPRCWYGPNYKRKRRQGKKGGKGWRYRRIHTTPERRASLAVTKEEQELYGVKVRCKRNARNIPNSWDDFHSKSEANWKNYRKTQWKE